MGEKVLPGGAGRGGGLIGLVGLSNELAVFLFLVSIRNPYSTCSRTYSAGLMLWNRVRLVGGEEP